MDTAHQTSSLTVEIRVDFLLKCRLVEVSTANSNAQSNGFLFSLASDILVNSNRGIDATTLAEKCADSSTGAFGGNEDDVLRRFRSQYCLFEVGNGAARQVSGVERSSCGSISIPYRKNLLRNVRTDVGRYVDFGQVLEDWGEAMREI